MSMIESLMLVAIGFLTATLLALVALQFVWRRAVAVTTKTVSESLNLEEAKSALEKAASQEILIHDLRDQRSLLQSQYDETRTLADNRESELVSIRERLAEIETAYADVHERYEAEFGCRTRLEDELKGMGERITRILGELGLQREQAQPAPATAAETAPASPQQSDSEQQPLSVVAEPVPVADRDHLYAEELAAIRASLDKSDVAQTEPSENDPATISQEQRIEPRFADARQSRKVRDAEAADLPPEHVLAERIRLLEAGVH